MGWKVSIQYKPEGRSRPLDYMQDESELELAELPNVGDTIAYKEDDKMVCRKVITRHFSVGHPENHWVNIVVTDCEPNEMAARLKE